MKRTIAAIALVLTTTLPAPAQITYAPGVVYGPGFAGGFAYRGGVGRFGGGFAYRSGFYASPVVPYYGWFPVAGPGWGPGYGNPYFLGPPAGLDLSNYNPPVLDLSAGGYAPYAPALPFGLNMPATPRPSGTLPRDPESALPTGVKKDDYLIIRPRPEGEAPPAKPAAKPKPGEPAIAPKLDKVAPPPARPGPPAFAFDPFADRKPAGKTDTPEADAGAEANRQVKEAVHAFATEKYGQAVEHFDRAIRARPDDAVSHFMKGQAQFAAGQYAEAVGSIRDGLKLAPDWPASGFKLKDLYGGKPDRFDADVAALRKAVAEHPDEPALQFLLAYQLWFGGERAEATKLFRAVATRLKDGAVVERFLKEAK